MGNFANDHLRYVFVERTRCPACGATDLQTLRSKTDQDGSVSRRTACRTCGHKFFVILEADCQNLASDQIAFG